VPESVRCPSCSSRYGLRLQRVKVGIKRARCFRCRSIFGIEAEVLRLLATAAAPAEPEAEPRDLPDFPPAPTHAVAAEMEAAWVPAEAPLVDVTDFEAPAEPEAALNLEAIPAADAEAEIESPSQFEADLEDGPPSLTLGDLEGAEEEILEKTLVVEPLDVAPPAQDVRATLPDAGGSYASAKDAISKLLGETPRVEAQPDRRPTHTGSTMDVEAALDALDSTLGGTSTPKDLAAKDLAPKDLGTKPVPQPAAFRIPIPEPPVAKPMNSTIKLSHEELMAAMAAASMPPQSPAPPKPVPPPAAPALPQLAHSPGPLDQNLYKVQLPKETQHNVSLDVLTTWIEQGRVQEFHMVARQQSEHWIEAGKVPALRMVFDRLKRAQAPMIQQSQATLLPPPTEAVPVKKGIFGGLFGRG
jgi:hypothetical protein